MELHYIPTFASKEDIEIWMELVELVQDNFPGLVIEDYKKALEQSITQKMALLVKTEGKAVGTMLFSYQNNEICFLAVHPQYRQNGIATALVTEMLKQLPEEAKITVSTFRQDDPKGKAARAFYTNLGFTPGALIEEFGYHCQQFVYTRK